MEKSEAEHKQAKEALKMISSRNEFILNSTSEGIYGVDLEGNTLFANTATTKLTGWEDTELIGKHQHDILHHTKPDGTPYPREECFIYAAMRDGKMYHVDNEVFWRKDGSSFPVEYTSTPLRDEHGKVIGASVVFWDITKRKQAEALIKESEDRYRNLFDNTNDMIQSVGLDGHFVIVNKAWLQTMGYTWDELQKLTVFDILHPDETAHCMKDFQSVTSGECLNNLQTRFIAKDGRTIYVEGNAFPRIVNEKIVATQGIFRDITERKKDEELLQKEKNKAQLYLNIAGVIIVALNVKGEVTLINQKGIEVLGYEQEEIIGKNWFDNFVPMSIKDQVKTYFYRMIAENIEPFKYYENLILTKSGEERVIAWHNAIVRDNKGAIKVSLSSGEDITERKRAEENLRRSEERKRKILETTMDGFWLTDIEGRLLEVNPAYEKMSGYSKEELLSMRVTDIEAKKSSEEIKAHIKKSIEQEGDRFETVHMRKDGSTFPLEMSANFIPADGGRFVSFLRDITERKKTEEELKRHKKHLEELVKIRTSALEESEHRFRAVFEGSGDAIMLLKRNGFFDCNARTLEMFGFETREAFTGVHPADVSPPRQPDGQDSLAAAQAWIETAFREGHCRFEWIHRRKNGEDFPAEVLLSAFRYGEEMILEAAVRDITERKLAEVKLRKLSRAVEESPASIVITDNKGNIEYVNPKFTRLTGYTTEEAIGQNPRILRSGHHPTDFYRELWETITSGKVWNGEFFNKKKNGTLYWESASISSIRDTSGVITHFIAVKEDITERKQADVVLQQAKEEAETANRTKSEFLANMSHELRTPLNSIIGFSEVMQGGLTGPVTDEQKEYLGDIWESGKHLLRLINDILDLSKIEAGKLTIEFSEFDVKDMIEECLILFKEKIMRHNINLTTDIASDTGTISADKTKFKQVMLNLLANAFKFTPDGGSVYIAARHVTMQDKDIVGSERGFIEISVADTGIGISPEDQKRLFQPFQQIETHLTKKHEGTGLGLKLCKELVELHGGKIWVVSDSGKGSKFIFAIPVRQVKNN